MIETLLFGYYVLPAVLCFALAVGARCLGRRRAALRHRILSLGIATAIALPVATAIIPASFHWRLPMELDVSPPAMIARHIPQAPRTPSPTARANDPDTARGLPAARRDLGRQPQNGVALRADRVPTAIWLLAISAVGCLVTGLCQLREGAALRRLAKRAVAAPALSAEVESLALRMGIDRRVEVLASEDLLVPITWGVRRSRIALPADAGTWGARRRETALLHELAHVRRGDALALALFRFAELLYWWNPLVWWLAATARGDAEVASDSVVVEAGISPVVYARELVATARAARPRAAPAPAVSLAGGLRLPQRVEELCRSDRRPGLLPRRTAWLLLLLSVTCGGAIATSSPSPPRASSPRDTAIPLPAVSDHRIQDAVRELLADPNPMVRRSAVNTLRDLEVEGLRDDPRLRALLDDPDPEVRTTTATVLGLMTARPNLAIDAAPHLPRRPTPEEITHLERRLASTDPVERERAVHALEELEGPGVALLLATALDDGSAHVRQAAAGALASAGGNEAVPLLARSLNDPNAHVRQAAAGSLGRIGSVSAPALPAVIEAATDPNEHVRQAAVDAIGDIGDPTARPALLTALADPNPFVRQSALNSLVELHRTSTAQRRSS